MNHSIHGHADTQPTTGCRLTEQTKALSVCIVWQSLVAPSYRSFFYQLAKLTDARMALVAPATFRELGRQQVSCAPWQKPFAQAHPTRLAATLKAVVWHTQIVFFRGLQTTLKKFFNAAASSPVPQVPTDRQYRVVVCIAEPYSLTALWVWACTRLALGKEFIFVCWTCQNLYKQFSWPLARTQAFLFSHSKAILCTGEEHIQVLRKQGFKGQCVPFPLWFDSELFQYQPQLNRRQQLMEARPNCAPLFNNQAVVIGFAGSLLVEKGILDLLDCLEQMAHHWASSISLAVAGNGPLKTLVEERLVTLTLLGYTTHYFGPLPVDLMPAFFGSLDILAVPSRTAANWKEQFGRVIVEAKACGVLVTGSNSGEIPHVIADPDAIFREGDLAHMSQTLEHLRSRIALHPNKELLRETLHNEVAASYSDVTLASRFVATLECGFEPQGPSL